MDEYTRKRIIFMGTPQFAEIILRNIYKSEKYNIVGVFTKPDNKKNKQNKSHIFSKVKDYALAHNLQLFQPSNLLCKGIDENIKKLNPDFIIVAAYGLIIPPNIICIPKYACVNVHASLLPRYRGASPIQRAIMENWGTDAKTGVSIMKITPGLDDGPVYAQDEINIGTHNSESLTLELAKIGSKLLLRVLDDIIINGITPVEQDENIVSYAPKIKKCEGIIDWSMTIEQIDAQVRAMFPWPGAQLNIILNNGRKISLQIDPGHIEPLTSTNYNLGDLIMEDKSLKIISNNGKYVLRSIKPANKGWLTSNDFYNGYLIKDAINQGKVIFNNHE